MGLAEDSSIGECLQAGLEFKAELVDEKELASLLRVNNPPTRRPSQLVDLLSNRIDYVSKNVETVRKQLSDAEKKRNALLLAEEPEHRDDAGLPLAEITEELDDSGNVISSKVQNPGTHAPQLIDVLKKVGISDLKETNGTITNTGSPSAGNHTPESTSASQLDTQNDLRTMSQHDPKRTSDSEEEALLRQEMLDYRNGMDEVGTIVAELDLEEGASDISYDEDDDNFDIDSDFDDSFDEDEDEDDEDEAGKSKQRLRLSRTYKQQMEELQEKLGVKNVGPEIAPKHNSMQENTTDRPPAAEAARKAAIARQTEAAKSSLKPHASEGEQVSKEKPKKKSVAFSSELDIAPESSKTEIHSSSQWAYSNIQKPYMRPVVESVIERTVPSSDEDTIAAGPPASEPPHRSLFKSSREGESQRRKPISDIPTEYSAETQNKAELNSTGPKPPQTIISRDLVERPGSKTSEAPDPNNFSDASHKREVAMEYQRMRMKRIHARQGGFVGDGEYENYGEAITPIRERDEETGKEKKVSRFKAARLNQ